MPTGKSKCPVCQGTGTVKEDAQEYEFVTRDPKTARCLVCNGSGYVNCREKLPNGQPVSTIMGNKARKKGEEHKPAPKPSPGISAKELKSIGLEAKYGPGAHITDGSPVPPEDEKPERKSRGHYRKKKERVEKFVAQLEAERAANKENREKVQPQMDTNAGAQINTNDNAQGAWKDTVVPRDIKQQINALLFYALPGECTIAEMANDAKVINDVIMQRWQGR